MTAGMLTTPIVTGPGSAPRASPDPAPAAGTPLRHGLSFDVECYYQCATLRLLGSPRLPGAEVARATREVLALLAAARLHATFFVLGNVARRFPSLIRDIVTGDHEIGVHGDTHQLVNRGSASAFREELRRARDAIFVACPGARVLGHRAPVRSISPGDGWAFDVLLEEGFLYDSSFFPLSEGALGDAPVVPYRLPNGLYEVPLTVVRLGGARLPALGGGYIRYTPLFYSRWALGRRVARGESAVLYFHPHELSREPLRYDWLLGARGARRVAECLFFQIQQRFGRGAPMRRKLDRLLREPGLVTLVELLRAHHPHLDRQA